MDFSTVSQGRNLGYVKDRSQRLEEIRHAGTRLMDMAEDHPLVVRNWLKSVMRIYVGKRATVERIEFIWLQSGR
jgi:hypothetical protein